MGCERPSTGSGWWGVALGTVAEGSTFFSFFSFPIRQRFALTAVTLGKVITSLTVIKCRVVSSLENDFLWICTSCNCPFPKGSLAWPKIPPH